MRLFQARFRVDLDKFIARKKKQANPEIVPLDIALRINARDPASIDQSRSRDVSLDQVIDATFCKFKVKHIVLPNSKKHIPGWIDLRIMPLEPNR